MKLWAATSSDPSSSRDCLRCQYPEGRREGDYRCRKHYITSSSHHGSNSSRPPGRRRPKEPLCQRQVRQPLRAKPNWRLTINAGKSSISSSRQKARRRRYKPPSTASRTRTRPFHSEHRVLALRLMLSPGASRNASRARSPPASWIAMKSLACRTALTGTWMPIWSS